MPILLGASEVIASHTVRHLKQQKDAIRKKRAIFESGLESQLPVGLELREKKKAMRKLYRQKRKARSDDGRAAKYQYDINETEKKNERLEEKFYAKQQKKLAEKKEQSKFIKEVAEDRKNVITPRQAKKTKWVAAYLLSHLTCEEADLIDYINCQVEREIAARLHAEITFTEKEVKFKPDIEVVTLEMTKRAGQQRLPLRTMLDKNTFDQGWSDYKESDEFVATGNEHWLLELPTILSFDDILQRFEQIQRVANHPGPGRTTGNQMYSNSCPEGGCKVLYDLKAITNYGCWCNFGSAFTTGWGKPVDKYDEVCRDLMLCMRCVRYDSNAGGYACNVINDKFNVQVAPNFVHKCGTANPGDPCGANMCCCWTDFIKELIDMIWDKPKYTPGFLHAKGFNRQSSCKQPEFENNSQVACCGHYPNRFPYGKNRMQCCGDSKVFNPTMQTCCDQAGTVRSTGDCNRI